VRGKIAVNTSRNAQFEEHRMNQNPTINFSHIGICVSDMQRSTRFYTEVLKFVVSHCLEAGPPFHIMTELPELKLKATFLRRDGVMIELLHYERPRVLGPAERRPMNQLGISHLSVTVDDLVAVTDLVEKYGGRVYPQTKVTTPAGDMMFCTDPDGVRIELWAKMT
jgi:catechol 2,3-dioxygenase-like lactoylglutathione lyase family enzyme